MGPLYHGETRLPGGIDFTSKSAVVVEESR